MSLLTPTYCATYWCTALQENAINLVMLRYLGRDLPEVLPSSSSFFIHVGVGELPGLWRPAARLSPRHRTESPSALPEMDQDLGQERQFNLCFIHCCISAFLFLLLTQQLSLLPLMEPLIGVNFAHFAPYGSGQLNGENLLSGNFGSASLDGVSDYYSQLAYKVRRAASSHWMSRLVHAMMC